MPVCHARPLGKCQMICLSLMHVSLWKPLHSSLQHPFGYASWICIGLVNVCLRYDNLKWLQPCDPVDLQLQVPAKVQLGCSWSVLSEKSWRRVHLRRCSRARVFFGIFSAGLNDLAFNPALRKSSLTDIFGSKK